MSARLTLQAQGSLPKMVSKRRVNRRVYRIKPFFLTLFALLGEHWQALNAESSYAIDPFPLPAIDRYRIPRTKRHPGEQDRGSIASKRRS